ncbi:MAG: Gfo/Idh/MocA family oxidoreductase [Kiritimatiellae bacterium]|nr:Gfo/Idh/MocA family oxidoreductase [Kiritimatiellia bacterium]
MSVIRLGVVGHGKRVSAFIRHVLRKAEPESVQPEIRVAGIVDPDETGARARLDERDCRDVVFYKTIDEMARRAKLDGLLIGTRCNLHTPYALQAACYDIPVFLEKPVSVNMRQAVSLEHAFLRSKSPPVVVSFPLRVSPLCVHARRLIQAGAVGSAEHISAVNYVSYGAAYWEKGYRDYKVTQGLFLQKATHDFDYLTFLMGAEITQVAAMANWGRVFGGKKRAGLTCGKCAEQRTCRESPQNRFRNGSGSRDDHLCTFSVDCGSPKTGMNEDCSSALLRFASGAHGVYSQVFFSRRDASARGAIVSGYLGTVGFDWYKNELKNVRHHEPFTDVATPAGVASHFGGDIELGRNFLDVIRGRAKSITPLPIGIQSVYACLAAKESSLTGRFVKVRQVGAVKK